jgi:hypothetical protein
MKIDTLLFGTVEAHYYRNSDGSEGLYVGDTFRDGLWRAAAGGMPGVLLAEDLVNPGAWGKLLKQTMMADLAGYGVPQRPAPQVTRAKASQRTIPQGQDTGAPRDSGSTGQTGTTQ